MATVQVKQSKSFFGKSVGKSETLTAEDIKTFELSIPGASTDLLVDIDAAISNAVGVFFVAEGGNLTVKTNSSSTPTDTLSLVDGEPEMWYTGGTGSNPITADITRIYVTNVPATAVDLTIIIARDT